MSGHHWMSHPLALILESYQFSSYKVFDRGVYLVTKIPFSLRSVQSTCSLSGSSSIS